MDRSARRPPGCIGGGRSITASDTIHVAQGTYEPTSGTDRSVSFEVIDPDDDITLKGDYIGWDEPDHDMRDVDAYTTILPG